MLSRARGRRNKADASADAMREEHRRVPRGNKLEKDFDIAMLDELDPSKQTKHLELKNADCARHRKEKKPPRKTRRL